MEHYQDLSKRGTVDVWQWMQEKQQLEMELAWELVDIFNGDAMIGPLRKTCHAASYEMWRGLNVLGKGQEIIQAVVKAEFFVGIMIKYGLVNPSLTSKEYEPLLYRMHKEAHRFDLNDCCELIRIYGTFVEMANKVGKEPYYANLDQIRDDYKHHGDRGPIWGKLDPEDKDKIPKVKEDLQKDPTLAGGRMRQKMEKLGAGPPPAWAAQLGPVREFLRSMGGGVDGWLMKEKNPLQRIDRLFGLASGAAISGTTTDTAFYIDQFALGKVSPIYYLLPLSYIVAASHHTIAEVGAALSVSESRSGAPVGIADISYSIGLYKTLLPGGIGEVPQENQLPADKQSVAAGARAIARLLGMAEVDPRNRLMLVYYDPKTQGPAGCLKFGRHEQDDFRELAQVNVEFLQKFKEAQWTWPTYQDVRELLRWAQLPMVEITPGTTVGEGKIFPATVLKGKNKGAKLPVVGYLAREIKDTKTGEIIKKATDYQLRTMDGKEVYRLVVTEDEDVALLLKCQKGTLIAAADQTWMQVLGPDPEDPKETAAARKKPKKG